MTTATLPDARLAEVRDRLWYALTVALVLWFAIVPVFGWSVSFFFYLMLWITMASAFNVISGFTGYMPFGYVAFYGVGAFATAILTKKFGWPLMLSLPMAGVAGVTLGLLMAPTLRLAGIYFAIVSLALSIICRLVITNLPDELTGGSFGINLGADVDPVHAFYVMLALMAAALVSVTWLSKSRLGKALRAIRDDPEAADAMGVNVTRARLYAWLIAAFYPSMCGGIEAWYTNVVDTETAFDVLITAKTIVYAMAGGLGTITGPVVGAVIMVWVDDLIWQQFPVLNLFLLGLLIVLLIQFLPRGIVGTLLQRRPRLRRYVM